MTEKKTSAYVWPFILVTCCFALWGFANDITNPMVKSFSRIFRMSVTDGALVQVAFYGGYFAMAFPAAMFIRKHSYKSGLLIGLALYAIGALMFIPAAGTGNYYPFLIAYFVLTCGLSFLETSANPFILSLGDKASATRRLNLAQSFNPIGSLAGMWVAMNFIQARMNPLGTSERAVLPDAEFEALKAADLAVVVKPYVAIGVVIVALLLLMVFTKMPRAVKTGLQDLRLRATIGRLWRNATYRYGVLAQFFYVGAQITCWTFIIQYGTQVFMAEGMGEQAAEIASQRLNIIAMVLFCASRFVCTWLMKYVKPVRMLALFALMAAMLVMVIILVGGRVGLYSLVGVSAFMSLMFPTIYGLALGGVGDDTEIGSAGLIMAILGGSLLPPLQALLIDSGHMSFSFIVPFICFVVVLIYAIKVGKNEKILQNTGVA
ncbi:MAG: L-fucose:H+ symporter permease [Bacteroidaceae bacterium]|nr:L-fucose:H+ symporter permease [Bacteroidaceae bacterium]MBQ9883728.1 L-fucose:H+ symporter permease [Bacteroidaceae bacterium]